MDSSGTCSRRIESIKSFLKLKFYDFIANVTMEEPNSGTP